MPTAAPPADFLRWRRLGAYPLPSFLKVNPVTDDKAFFESLSPAERGHYDACNRMMKHVYHYNDQRRHDAIKASILAARPAPAPTATKIATPADRYIECAIAARNAPTPDYVRDAQRRWLGGAK